MEHARTVSLTVQMPEALSYHSRYLDERGGLYGADFRAGLALGQCLLAEHYLRAKRFMEAYRRETNAVLREVDVLVTPATPVIAPKIGTSHVTLDGVSEAVGNALTRYTTFFNMTGHPAITVPVGLHSEGLPMAVQIVGGAFDEAGILRVAGAIEKDERFRIPLPDLVCSINQARNGA
jgi:aspartyl-tRNA(Asn)/glutamyl-tRNA(Gln) amidotransferase subunit A